MKKVDRGSYDPGLSYLTKLWRNILVSCNVDMDTLDALLLKWLDDPANKIPKDAKTRSFTRGNLMKALSLDDMTWKTFTKGLLLLRPDSIEVTVKLNFPKFSREHKVIILPEEVDRPSLDYPDRDELI